MADPLLTPKCDLCIVAAGTCCVCSTCAFCGCRFGMKKAYESQAARIAELEAALRELRREYFVAGGEMTTTEACRLIDGCVAPAS